MRLVERVSPVLPAGLAMLRDGVKELGARLGRLPLAVRVFLKRLITGA